MKFSPTAFRPQHASSYHDSRSCPLVQSGGLWLSVMCRCHRVRHAPGRELMALVAGYQGAIQIKRRTNQGQMGKRLWEIPQCLSTGPSLLRIQPQVISVAQHLFKHQPSLFELAAIDLSGPRQCFDEPEGAHIECALQTVDTVGGLAYVIAI